MGSQEVREKVAVLGCGIMGAPMARNLLTDGFEVRVWNRAQAKAEALAKVGAQLASSPAEAVAGASVVFTMLSDGPATCAVMTPAVLAAFGENAIWIQSATVGVPAITELANLAAEAGVAFVDAPVLGSREAAEGAKLVVVAAGDEALRPRCNRVFGAVGARTLWVGPVGAASKLKLVVNNWVVGLSGLLGETLSLARALEVEPSAFLSAIEGGAVDCGLAQVKGRAMLTRDYTPSFPLRWARKDARLIDEAARHAALPLSITRAVERYFAQAEQVGHGDDDFSAIFEAIRTAR